MLQLLKVKHDLGGEGMGALSLLGLLLLVGVVMLVVLIGLVIFLFVKK